MSKNKGNRLLHRLDRAILPVLLYMLSMFLRRKNSEVVHKKIGILKIVSIGDLVIATALLRDLRQKFPDSELHLFLGEDNQKLGRLLPIEGLILHTLKIKQPLTNLRTIRREQFDLFIDLGDWTRYEALLAGLSGAKRILGFKTPGQHRHYLYHDTVCHDDTIHQLENLQNLARLAGGSGTYAPLLVPPMDIKPPLSLKEAHHVAFLHAWPSGIHSDLKEWPDTHWVELGQTLVAQGFKLYLTGAPADRQKQDRLLAAFAKENIPVHDLCGKLNLQQLACAFASHTGDLLVSVNTGIMHMAAAYGLRTICLNGPTNPIRWGGVGTNVTNLTPPNHIQSGYLNLGFEYPKNAEAIMQHISVADVLLALKDQPNHISRA